ncbi:hypothetical protein MPH47_04280 [Psychrobacillus psychrodurans]|uniref:hypothetical protein n=1 Tax=Psychrobacillus psychrodurans TaxID=126157 RepID=UPI001F4D6BCE|nr:hypothetical protein [Psychrobacillus psychrodurans]MCK1996463.1 hypothetical protein [Psychrobacillus psychrodurans]
MKPAERKKLNEYRTKVKGYRIRLMALANKVPNVNELWQNEDKMVQFFESKEVEKYEAMLTSSNESLGKSETVKTKPKIKTELTVEKFKELKAAYVNDKTIMKDFGMNANQLNAWKKANGVIGMSIPKGAGALAKKIQEKEAAVVTTAIDYQAELNIALRQIKALESDIESYKLQSTSLREKEESLQQKSIALQSQIERNSQLMEQFANAQKLEREAVQELIIYQDDYRKLEVDYRNLSTEMARYKTMLDRLKHTEQINVWLMKQHIGFVEQADDRAEAFS